MVLRLPLPDRALLTAAAPSAPAAPLAIGAATAAILAAVSAATPKLTNPAMINERNPPLCLVRAFWTQSLTLHRPRSRGFFLAL